jgi:hypothetical protein
MVCLLRKMVRSLALTELCSHANIPNDSDAPYQLAEVGPLRNDGQTGLIRMDEKWASWKTSVPWQEIAFSSLGIG